MDDDLRDSGFEIRDRVQIELLPLIARHLWSGNDYRVERDVVCRQRRWGPPERVGSQCEKWEMVIVRHLDEGRKKYRRREQRAHVAVEVRRLDAERYRPVYLRPELALDFGGLCSFRNNTVLVGQRAVGIEQ